MKANMVISSIPFEIEYTSDPSKFTPNKTIYTISSVQVGGIDIANIIEEGLWIRIQHNLEQLDK